MLTTASEHSSTFIRAPAACLLSPASLGPEPLSGGDLSAMAPNAE